MRKLRRVIADRRFLVAVLVFAIIAGVVHFQNRPAPSCDGSCNVILIMIDTLSADHLKAYGYDRDTMPKVEKFFENGVRFQNAYSVAPWTEPSFASLFFSDMPSNITYKDLDGDRPTFVSALRGNGYAVGAVLLPEVNFIYDSIAKVFRPDERTFHSAIGSLNLESNLSEPRFAMRSLSTLQLEHARSGKPFFFMLHSFGPHAPYTPYPKHRDTFSTPVEYTSATAVEINQHNKDRDLTPQLMADYRLLYDQRIRDVDDGIAQFLNSIDAETLKHTVIILAADHGEAFGEHGKLGHHQSLYREETHVPLFILAPGVSKRVVEDPVSILDLGPTILSIAGVPAPAGFIGVDHSSLRGTFSLVNRGIPIEDGQPFFMAMVSKSVPTLESAGALHSDKPIIDEKEYGLQVGDWRFFTEKGVSHIYNLANDPMEKVDVMNDTSSLSLWQKASLLYFKLRVVLSGRSLEAPALQQGDLPYNIQG